MIDGVSLNTLSQYIALPLPLVAEMRPQIACCRRPAGYLCVNIDHSRRTSSKCCPWHGLYLYTVMHLVIFCPFHSLLYFWRLGDKLHATANWQPFECEHKPFTQNVQQMLSMAWPIVAHNDAFCPVLSILNVSHFLFFTCCYSTKS